MLYCKYKYSLIAGTGVKMRKMGVKNTVRRCYSLIGNISERRMNFEKNANKHVKQFKIYVHYLIFFTFWSVMLV